MEKLNVAVEVGIDLVGSENCGESLRQFGGIGRDVGAVGHAPLGADTVWPA
jgi:hypothetical protein